MKKIKRKFLIVYLIGLALTFALALLTTGCETLFREDVQQVPEPPPGTNTLSVTNLALAPEMATAIQQTGGMFGPIGEAAAGVVLGGLGLYLAIRNRKLKREVIGKTDDGS